jgi:hypothetical protein
MQKMTTMTNPITPPDKQLVRKWIEDWAGGQMKGPVTEDQLVVATQAAQWGANQELEACCEWLECNYNYPQVNHPLRAARRPKPPSLKEQALEALQFVDKKLDLPLHNHCNAIHTIRRALEALDD